MPFDCSSESPINVVVGANGSGKTIFCKAIAWALGQHEPNFARWAHRGTASASVTLAFTLGGQTYEVERRLLEAGSGHWEGSSQLKVKADSGESWKFSDNPEQQLQALFPPDFRAVLVDSHANNLYQEETHKKYRIPEFIAWAIQRIEEPDISSYECYHDRPAPIIRAILGGKATNTGSSAVVLAALLVQALFREWILTTGNLPFNWKHLHGESLPWLIDSPFFLLDSAYATVAAQLFVKSKCQVVLASSPAGLSASIESVLTPKVGGIAVFREGHTPRCGPTAEIFGRELVLTREDDTEFVEIASV